MKPNKILIPFALFCSIQTCCAKATSDQIHKGEADLEKGNYGTLLKSLPDDDVRALILKGRALLATDCGEGGLFFVKAVELAPNDPQALAWAAAGRIKWRQYSEALASLKKALLTNPRSPELHSMLGRALFKTGDVDGGFEEMNKAIKLDPKSFVGYTNLSDSHSDQLETAKAQADLDVLRKLHPSNPLLLAKSAQLKEDAGDVKGALNDYATALSINPHYQLAYWRQANMQSYKGQCKKAIENCNQCLQADSVPELTRKCRQTRAKCEGELALHAAVIADTNILLKDVSKLRQIDGTTEKLLFLRAEAYRGLKDYPKALETIALLQKYKKQSTDALVLCAKVHSEMGETRSALDDYNGLIAIDSNVADWFKARAAIFQKLGRADAAQRDLKKAKELEASL